MTIENNVTSIPPVFSYRKMVYSSAYIIVGMHSLPKKSAFLLLCSRRLCSASCCIFCSSIPDMPIFICVFCGVFCGMFCENCWGFMLPILLLLSIAFSLLLTISVVIFSYFLLTGKLIVLHRFWFCNIFLSFYDKSVLIPTI